MKRNIFLKRKQKDIKPWKKNKNIISNLPEYKSFYNLSEGPKMGSLKIESLKEENDFETIKLKRLYIFGHSFLMIDPYLGTVSFSPGKMKNKNKLKFYEKLDLILKNKIKIDHKIGITLTWFQGGLPFNFLRPRRVYSENISITRQKWSGEIVITLKDWRSKPPILIYNFYLLLFTLLAILSSTLVPIFTILRR